MGAHWSQAQSPCAGVVTMSAATATATAIARRRHKAPALALSHARRPPPPADDDLVAGTKPLRWRCHHGGHRDLLVPRLLSQAQSPCAGVVTPSRTRGCTAVRRSQAQSPCAGVVTLDLRSALRLLFVVAGTKPLRWRCHYDWAIMNDDEKLVAGTKPLRWRCHAGREKMGPIGILVAGTKPLRWRCHMRTAPRTPRQRPSRRHKAPALALSHRGPVRAKGRVGVAGTKPLRWRCHCRG